MKKLFKVKAKIEQETLDCFGTIEIQWKNEEIIYYTWKVCKDDILIASKSSNLLLLGENYNKDDIFNKVIQKIETFKIGRKKIFENIEICQ